MPVAGRVRVPAEIGRKLFGLVDLPADKEYLFVNRSDIEDAMATLGSNAVLTQRLLRTTELVQKLSACPTATVLIVDPGCTSFELHHCHITSSSKCPDVCSCGLRSNGYIKGTQDGKVFMGVIGRRFSPEGETRFCAYPMHDMIGVDLFKDSFYVLAKAFTNRDKQDGQESKQGALCAACTHPLPSTGQWCFGCFTNVMLCDTNCQRKYWKAEHKLVCAPSAQLVLALSTTAGVLPS